MDKLSGTGSQSYSDLGKGVLKDWRKSHKGSRTSVKYCMGRIWKVERRGEAFQIDNCMLAGRSHPGGSDSWRKGKVWLEEYSVSKGTKLG